MRWLLSIVLFTISLAPVSALDAESKTAYELKVVVRFADHPHFTPHYRSEFRKELQGALQAALGPLGNVQVIDLKNVDPTKWEPVWKLAAEKGLTALEQYVEVTGVKTHFLNVDYRDGQYELQARQHDGSTGFSTPRVRQNQTRDRGFVSRLGSLMIAQDFGIVGTIEPPRQGELLARVQLRGGAINTDLGNWVKKGDIFAVIQISQYTSRTPTKKDAKTPSKEVVKTVGVRMEGLILQAANDARQGEVACTMFTRYEDPLPIRGRILGYRCIKLGVTDAPLRLQLVDEKGNPHKLGSLQVRVHPERFPDLATEGEDAPLINGVFQSKRTFSGMALVRVSIGERPLARIPIEITGDQVIVRQLRIEAGAETRSRLEVARRDAMSRIIDARQVQVQLIRDLTILENERKRDEALRRGEMTYKLIEADIASSTEELARLKERAERDLPNGKDFVRDCEQQIVVLKDKQVELLDHLGKLRTAVEEENSPEVKGKRNSIQDTVRQAELAAQQADYDTALKKYQEAADMLEDPDAKAKVQATHDGLKKAWEIRDEAHMEARRFIYEVWAKIDSTQAIKDNLAKARESYEKCKSVGDRLTLNKMLLSAADVLKPLVTQIEQLGEASDPDAIQNLMMLKSLGDDLEKLLADLTATIKGQ